MTQKTLPNDLTNFDFLKTVAVIIMIIDHMGFFFFPEDEYYRAIGRMGFPVWFFLVGYASGRDIPPKLWAGACILVIVNPLVGIPLLPLNALFTIIFIRLIIDRFAVRVFSNFENFVISGFFMLILMIPTFLLVEYGTQALITALFGYAVRNHPVLGAGSKGRNVVPLVYAAFTWLSFVGVQQFLFQFTMPAFITMAAGTGLFIFVLYNLRLATYPELTRRLPGIVSGLIRLGGRRTLEIYVIHLLLFKIAAALLHPEIYNWFDLVAINMDRPGWPLTYK